MLKVTYGANGAVAMTCVPTTLEDLQVSVTGGDGNDTVVSDRKHCGDGSQPGSRMASAGRVRHR